MFRAEDKTIYTHPDNVMANGLTVGEAVIRWFKEKGFERHPARKAELFQMRNLPPLFVKPTQSNARWTFCDIEACYPSIYSRLRWDDEMGEVVKKGRPQWAMSDFPMLTNKRARSAVVGICYGGVSHEVKNHQIVSSRKWRGYWNPHLIHLIMTVAHDVAHHAIAEHGAIYWNTDGGIVPALAFPRLARYAREVYGLNLREQATGTADVIASGVYRVANKVSEPMASGAVTRRRSFNRVDKITRHEVDGLMYLMR
jgi:hypothetical protein